MLERIARPIGSLYQGIKRAASKAKKYVSFRGRQASKTVLPPQPVTPSSPLLSSEPPSLSLSQRSSSSSSLSSSQYLSATSSVSEDYVSASTSSFHVDTELQQKLAATQTDKPALPPTVQASIDAARSIANLLTQIEGNYHQFLPSAAELYEQSSIPDKTGQNPMQVIPNHEEEPEESTGIINRIKQWKGSVRFGNKAKSSGKLPANIPPIKEKEAVRLRKAFLKLNRWTESPYTPETLDTIALQLTTLLVSGRNPEEENLESIREQLAELSELQHYLPPAEKRTIAHQLKALNLLYDGLSHSRSQHRMHLMESYLPGGIHFEAACKNSGLEPDQAFSTTELKNYTRVVHYHQNSQLTSNNQLEEVLKEELEVLIQQAMHPTHQKQQYAPATTIPVKDQLAMLAHASPFFPEGAAFLKLCEALRIDNIYNHLSVETIEGYRAAIKQLVNDYADKDMQTFDEALQSLALNLFKSVNSKPVKALGEQELIYLISQTLDSIRRSPTGLQEEYQPVTFGDNSPALARTGQQLQCYLHTEKESLQPAIEFRCEKAEFHQHIVNTVIDRWYQYRDHLDAQIRARIADCDALDFQNNTKVADAEYSELRRKITQLNHEKQTLKFPELPSLTITAPDSRPLDSDFFYKAGITSAVAKVQFSTTDQARNTKAVAAITTTPTFKNNLTSWQTQSDYMNHVMARSCQYVYGDIDNHGVLSQDEKETLDLCFQQTNSAINELLLTPGQDGAIEALHLLRMQAALLTTYANQLDYYLPPQV